MEGKIIDENEACDEEEQRDQKPFVHFKMKHFIAQEYLANTHKELSTKACNSASDGLVSGNKDKIEYNVDEDAAHSHIVIMF
jgi:hypothetical protein